MASRPSGNHQNKVICPGKWPQKLTKVPLASDLVIFGMIIKGSKGTNVKKGLEFQQVQERKKSKRFEGFKKGPKVPKLSWVPKVPTVSKVPMVPKVSKVPKFPKSKVEIIGSRDPSCQFSTLVEPYPQNVRWLVS